MKNRVLILLSFVLLIITGSCQVHESNDSISERLTNIERNLGLTPMEHASIERRVVRIDSLFSLQEKVVIRFVKDGRDTIKMNEPYIASVFLHRYFPQESQKAIISINDSIIDLEYDPIWGSFEIEIIGEKRGLNECLGMLITGVGDTLYFDCPFVVE